MNNLQAPKIQHQSNNAVYLVDIKCKSCDAVTRAADIVFGADNAIGFENIINATYDCSGCHKPQPYTIDDIVRANRAGTMADHIIESFPTKNINPLHTGLWVNTHTNKMLIVQDSVPTFSNVQNALFIPLANELDIIELNYQLAYDLNNNPCVPEVVQQLLKQWNAIHPFMLTPDELIQPGAIFDVCLLTIEKSLPKLTAHRTFLGSKLNRKAYFLDNDNLNLLTDPHIFNKSITVTLNSACKMIFHGGKSLHLFVVTQSSEPYLLGKYIEAKWDEETNICTPLAIYDEAPSFMD